MISLEEIKRIAARTAVRRVVGTIVAIVIAAAISWASPARAQDVSRCNDVQANSVHCQTKPQAYAAARAAAQAWLARGNEGYGPPNNQLCVSEQSGRIYAGYLNVAYSCPTQLSQWGNGTYNRTWLEDCPADEPWNLQTGRCGNPCTNAPSVAFGSISGGQPMCVNGCTYVPDTSAGTSLGYENPQGNSIFTAANSFKSNGIECNAENHPQPWDPQKPTCQTVPGGAFNHCTMPDGTNCVTTAKGRRLCWGGDETGPRMTQDGTEGANRQPYGTPTPPPQNMKDPQAAGTVSNTTNDNRTSTTVYNGGGNAGGQGNVGSGGSEGGAGEGGEGDDIDFGTPGAGLGFLYEGSGYTEDSVASSIFAAAQATQLAQGITHFFSVPSSGACPSWTLAASQFWEAMSIDQHCSGEFAAMLAAGGWVILAALVFLAFRIAFY